jgi:hypothetical protein
VLVRLCCTKMETKKRKFDELQRNCILCSNPSSSRCKFVLCARHCVDKPEDCGFQKHTKSKSSKLKPGDSLSEMTSDSMYIFLFLFHQLTWFLDSNPKCVLCSNQISSKCLLSMCGDHCKSDGRPCLFHSTPNISTDSMEIEVTAENLDEEMLPSKKSLVNLILPCFLCNQRGKPLKNHPVLPFLVICVFRCESNRLQDIILEKVP